ncbi:hypothetical protein BA1DRAFT_00506 [Photorhabdus aegyptia]|uniref:Uncharacterized protein n=1 Tax=Photorhabdus aegyptia TaxID=2805098 RepID=A0A022PN03_9GAMM|nr:hypothetical protein BA1DRAFT_00506 [Photorhabdus aegyptia]
MYLPLSRIEVEEFYARLSLMPMDNTYILY